MTHANEEARAVLADKCHVLCCLVGVTQFCYSLVYGIWADDGSVYFFFASLDGSAGELSASRVFTVNVLCIGLYLSAATFATAALCHYKRKVARISLMFCLAFAAWLAFQHAQNSLGALGLVYIVFVVLAGLLLSADYNIDSTVNKAERANDQLD